MAMPAPASRTHQIATAIRQELERHREEIDRNPEFRSLTITVKLNRGHVRLVVVSRETEHWIPG
jgi:hypothetical protein